MSSKHAAFAKVRARIRRQIVEVEESEHEGGELNLVPYLDIITNTVIFLLATTVSVLAIANINVSAPRYAEPVAGATTSDPQNDPDERLNLTIAVSYKGFIVAGAGGVMKAPDGTLPTIKCATALRNERCPAYLGTRTDERTGEPVPVWIDKYNYKALIDMLTKIKKRYPAERQVILSGDRTVPYQVVVRTMDKIRGTRTKECKPKEGCLFDQVVLSAGVQ